MIPPSSPKGVTLNVNRGLKGMAAKWIQRFPHGQKVLDGGLREVINRAIEPLIGPYTNPSSVNPQPSTALQGAQLGIAAAGLNPNLPAPSTSQSFTNWLNANSSTALWVGGIALVVLMLSRVAR